MKPFRSPLWTALLLAAGIAAAAPYEDRFVWVFGWNLGQDSDVDAIAKVLDTAGKHGCNGAVLSAGLDTLCLKKPDYFRRLDAVREACGRNGLELIPAVFSVGYGSAVLAHDRNLAEGLPVEGALFVARGGEARHEPDPSVRGVNGGFEDFAGNRFAGFRFHDQPGVVSFADTNFAHGGRASMRFENFTANPHGHGRVMQEVRVPPFRCCRVAAWVRTEGLEPADAFKMMALGEGGRTLGSRGADPGPAAGGWRKVTMTFNSLQGGVVRLYAGVWGGRAGKVWTDDWTIEEADPTRVLRRPGTPVTVRSEDGAVTFVEGRDYAPFEESAAGSSRADRPAPTLRLLPGGAIGEGRRLRVSWYYAAPVQDGQIGVCMAEPALYEIFDHEAKLLAERLHPHKVLLSMDEIRMGGTCRACAGRNMGELLGECLTKQVGILRRHMPGVEVYAWSDMLDPNHNAHGDYYLVRGDFTGSWRHVPKDLRIAVWGGAPREKSLKFFAGEGFRTLVSCYYDADSLDSVKGWLDLARGLPGVQGFMYTPWRKKYDLLPAFGDMVKAEDSRP